MYTEYHASARIADIDWFRAGKHGEAEVYAGIVRKLTKLLTHLFVTRRDH